MARPKKQINRKTDILDAAQLIFVQKGFEKTTIDEIAKHIGIGKGTVYLDFKNKEDILKAIIEKNVNHKLERIEFEIKEAKPPFLELLEKLLRQDVLDVFDKATSTVHTHVALMHTSYQFKQDLKHLILREQNMIATLLEKSANNQEIKQFPDYINLAHLIKISLQGFFPPYDLKYSLDHRVDLNKAEIRSMLFNDASIVIEIILCGLRN